jgi:hypothetical protein
MARPPGTTDVEVARRVEAVMGHLAIGASRGQILEWAQSSACQWRDAGDPVSASTIDRYIRKAKAEFRKLAQPRKEYLLGVAHHRLGTLYQRSFQIDDYKTCLAVQAETNKLGGLYPATKTEITGRDGGPIEVSDARERLAARIAALAAAGAADGAPQQPE